MSRTSELLKQKKKEREQTAPLIEQATTTGGGTTPATGSRTQQVLSGQESNSRTRKIIADKILEQGVEGYNTWASGVSSLSKRLSDDYAARQGKYQSGADFKRYRDENSATIGDYRYQAGVYRDYFTDNASSFDPEQLRAAQEALAQLEEYLAAASGNLDAEADFWSQFADEAAYTAYLNGEPIQEPAREATWRDALLGSLKRGYYNSLLGEETFAQMMGEENEAEKYGEMLAGEEYNFEADGWFKKAVSGAAELLGQQARQFTNPDTLNTALLGAGTFAGGALALGQAGPQIAAPEEVITVPAAALAGLKAGFTTGSAASNLEIEAGHAYNEMIQQGISEEVARNIALGVGGINAALEFVQADELLKSFKVLNKTGASDTVLKRITDELAARGIDVAKETAQEVAQEGITIAGTQAASAIENGEWAYDASEVLERLGETALSSALSFGVLNVPGGVFNVATGGQTQQTTPIT